MRSHPQVSIVMPVYNAERYVTEAVESVLSQTFSDFEFLVFDDGSTDRSLMIVEQYAARDQRLRVFAKQHKGYAPWLNEGIRIARGDFIARMDADDVSLNQRLKHQVKYLHDNPRCVAVGCDFVIIDGSGQELGTDRLERRPEVIEQLLLNGTHGVLPHPASMMRREAVVAIGSYREKFEGIEDFDLWLRLIEVGQLTNIPHILFKYRLHPTSVCSTQFRTQGRHADTIIAEARVRRGLEPLKRSIWPIVHDSDDEAARLQLWSGCFVGLGKRGVAFRYAILALLRQPFSITSWMTLGRVLLPQPIKNALKTIPLRGCHSRSRSY